MTQSLYKIISTVFLVIIVILSFIIIRFENDVSCNNHESLTEKRLQMGKGFQTSARYISKIVELDACVKKPGNPDKEQLDRYKRQQQLHPLIKDLEIKASSYAFINKLFFLASLVLAIGIIVVPIVNSFTREGTIAHKLFNPVQLPAITLLAALCFNFYSDYKGKQTSVENLMRYAYFSGNQIKEISQTVREGLSKIDGGQDFSRLIPQ